MFDISPPVCSSDRQIPKYQQNRKRPDNRYDPGNLRSLPRLTTSSRLRNASPDLMRTWDRLPACQSGLDRNVAQTSPTRQRGWLRRSACEKADVGLCHRVTPQLPSLARRASVASAEHFAQHSDQGPVCRRQAGFQPVSQARQARCLSHFQPSRIIRARRQAHCFTASERKAAIVS